VEAASLCVSRAACTATGKQRRSRGALAEKVATYALGNGGGKGRQKLDPTDHTILALRARCPSPLSAIDSTLGPVTRLRLVALLPPRVTLHTREMKTCHP
jgi:hypothetical protein